MSRAEAPILTTERFLESWQINDTHPDRLVAELVSLQNETHRKPDVYHFGIESDQLVDPETGQPVLDFIAQGDERTIAEKLERWAVENGEGNAYWISPEKEGIYPCNKLILHQIAYTGNNEKVILNTAILFDGDLDNSEEIRQQFVQTDDEGLAEIITWVENYTGKKVTGSSYTQSERQQAQHYAQQLSNGVSFDVIARQMQEDNFIGNNPISCPTRIVNQTFSTSILGNANIVNISSEKGWSYTPGLCRDCKRMSEQVGPCDICIVCEKKYD